MAWIVNSRHRRSIAFVDDANPQKRAVDASISPLHYQSVLDSGNYDAPINLSPVRIQNAQLDGWRVVANDWHYALGRPGNKVTDGWFGFGGRQGQHWLMTRLFRLGYIRWNDKLWTDVGGAPSYNRSNLSQETHTWTCPTNGEQFNLMTAATWANIWQAPGGGVVDADWRAHPLGLKEHIYINQAGRDYIASQWPGGSTTTRYFSLAFQVDALDIPAWKLDGVLQQSIDDVDNGSSGIVTGETAAGQLLFSLPLDWAWVEDENGEEIAGSRIPLRKRLYLDNGQYILLVGARVDQLNSLPSGTLVFDPTVDTQVAASANDAHENLAGASFSSSIYLNINSNSNTSLAFGAGVLFTLAGPASGDTIDVAYATFLLNETGRNDVLADIYCNDVDSAANFATEADVISRTRTTASVEWSAVDVAGDLTTPFNSPSIVGPVQEVVNRPGWASGNDIVILLIGQNVATARNLRVESYDTDSTQAPALHIEYTAGGITQAIGLNTETDTAQAIARLKTRTAGLNSETDTALAIARLKTAALGLLAETDTPLPMTVLKTRAIGQASEADTALPLETGIEQAIGQATETDTALPITAVKTRAIGLATETDAPLAMMTAKSRAIGLNTETDTAQALAVSKAKAIGLATETDEALGLAALGQIGLASETDTALPLTAVKTKAIGLVSETDSPLAMTRLKTAALGLASETDSTLAITSVKAKAIGIVAETDSGLALVVVKSRLLGLASETDTVQGMASAKARSIGLATETDLALALVIAAIQLAIYTASVYCNPTPAESLDSNPTPAAEVKSG